jgi:hypothetical protein
MCVGFATVRTQAHRVLLTLILTSHTVSSSPQPLPPGLLLQSARPPLARKRLAASQSGFSTQTHRHQLRLAMMLLSMSLRTSRFRVLKLTKFPTHRCLAASPSGAALSMAALVLMFLEGKLRRACSNGLSIVDLHLPPNNRVCIIRLRSPNSGWCSPQPWRSLVVGVSVVR